MKALSPAYTAESDVKNTRLADYDPDNWSDPEDNFLSDSSSEPDIILERTSSVSTVVSSATLRDSKYQQQQSQHHHNGDQRRQLYQVNCTSYCYKYDHQTLPPLLITYCLSWRDLKIYRFPNEHSCRSLLG